MFRSIATIIMAMSLMVGFAPVAFAQPTGMSVTAGRVETKPCNLTPRKAARDLTGDVANSVHFFWGSPELRYDGPEVLVRVKRDYMVIDYLGGVYLQHRSVRLSNFGVFCYDRPIGVGYTAVPAQEGCLNGVSDGNDSEAVQWFVDNLGGRKSGWDAWSSNAFRFKAKKRALFTAPLDAHVWLYDKKFMATPGYEVRSRNFLLYCYPFEG